jgi:hypothetical protein
MIDMTKLDETYVIETVTMESVGVDGCGLTANECGLLGGRVSS